MPLQNPINVAAAELSAPPAQDSINAPGGASIAHDYGKRRMKAIPVYAHELRTLGLLNTLATGFFSFASFCAAVVLNVVISGILAENLTHTAKVSLWFGGVTAGLMAAAALILAFVMLRLRGSGVTAIEGETTFDS